MNTFVCAVCKVSFQSKRKLQVTCSYSCRGVRGGHGNIKECVADRFWMRVKRRGEDECWPWIGKLNWCGYGLFSVAEIKSEIRAHRFSYELLVALIPDGLEIDHLCCNPACVNPKHLEPVTHAENTRRISLRGRHWAHKRTHCPNGHDLAGNRRTVHHSDSTTSRVCVICEQARRDRWIVNHPYASRASRPSTPEIRARKAKYARERQRRIDAQGADARDRRLAIRRAQRLVAKQNGPITHKAIQEALAKLDGKDGQA